MGVSVLKREEAEMYEKENEQETGTRRWYTRIHSIHDMCININITNKYYCSEIILT